MKSLIVSFAGKNITIAEVSGKKEILLLENIIAEDDISESITLDRYNDRMIFSYSDLINSALKGKSFKEHRVALLVDSSIAFMNLMPIDYNDPADNIRSQILWDLSNYFPQNYKEFNINYFRLKKNNISLDVKDTLVIALHKVKMEFIKSILEFCNLNVNITDIDHLSAEKCIRSVYGIDFKNKKNLILGIKKDKADLSIIDNTDIYYFDYMIADSYNYQERFIKTLSNIYEMNLDISFEKIFIYGDNNVRNMQNIVFSVFPEKDILISNPLPIFNYSAVKETSDNIENEGYKYTSLLGLALKSV